MKKLNLFIAILFLAGSGFSQSSWQAQNSGVNNFLFDVHFINHTEGWISGNTGLILHTLDGGAEWEEVEAPANNTYYSIFFFDAMNGWATGFGGKIIRTTDGGENWNTQNPASSQFLYDVFFVDENNGWAVGGDNGTYPSFISEQEILYTSNGGQTWTSQLHETYESVLKSVHFNSIDNGYAVGESGTVLYTSDGGQSWIEVMSDQSYHMTAVYTTNSSTAYVTAEYLGLPHVPVIFKTTDNGATWSSQTFTEDISLSSITFSDDMNGWAAGGNNESSVVLKTTNGGESWTYDYPAAGEYLTSVFFVDNENGWAVGAGGSVISTSRLFTGIEDSPLESGVNIYPNPATSLINIKFNEASESNLQISVFNMNGQIVYSRSSLNASQDQHIQIPVESFTPGIYQLMITSNSQTYAEKLIVK